ncbi:hypothetical protein F4781DRAFT_427098 [Annulohypoxylon bovei var. microspora]|nr:hypothetical protein F4781DRAFT_427098 [Annulohypoxylon bovei var. microspora]
MSYGEVGAGHAPYEYEDEVPEQPKVPGEEKMWFGKFEGTQLDQLTDNYRWTIYRLAREKPSPLLQEFRQLHDEYTSWLDERQSPLSTKVWFGKHKGHELRILYTRPRRWRWLVKNTVWGPELDGIGRRYLAYKAKHPRRLPVSRARPVILNPVGERLGPADDRAASDNDEDYDTDDGFIVNSDEEMEYSDSDEGDSYEDEEDEDGEYFTDSDNSGTIEDEEMVEVLSNHGDSDSSSSLPSLAEIVRRSASKKTPSKSTPRSKNRFQPYPNSTPTKSKSTFRKYVISSDDDDDEDDDVPIFTPSTSTGKARKTHDIFAELRTPKSNSSRVAAKRTSSELSPSRAAKNRQSITIVLSSESEAEEQPRRSCERCGQKLPDRTGNTALDDSDDEPLVPKLRKGKVAKKQD